MEENKKSEDIEEVIEEKEEKEEVEVKKKSQEEIIKELEDKNLRLLAEFANFKKRTAKEKSDIYSYANEKIIKELLVVLDNFSRAKESVLKKGNEELTKEFNSGVLLIEKSINSLLENEGVKTIDTKDKEFDPNMHFAAMTEEREGVEEGMILEELQKGYILNEKVIRPSMVKVSK